MTTVAYTSDLHLDFGGLILDRSVQADALFILGDTAEAKLFDQASNKDSSKFKEAFNKLKFLIDASDHFPEVIMIMGNHEHYSSRLDKTQDRIQKYLDFYSLDNVKLVENTFFEWKGFKVVAGTGWTDMGNAVDKARIGCGMNDFRYIVHKGPRGYTKFRPDDAAAIHAKFLNLIYKHQPDIVLMHHGPSELSLSDYYRYNSTINAGYVSRQMQHLIEIGQISPKYIFHGHVHQVFDYTYCGTRVLANPRGYVGYEDTDSWNLKTICLTT